MGHAAAREQGNADDGTHTVLIKPAGITIEVRPGETVMAAANRQRLYWPTTCNGEARCSTCTFTVVEALSNVAPMSNLERKCLLNQRGPDALEQPMRLGCQATITGDVVVVKYGVQPYP